jgi:hypothetical protein
VVARVGGRLPLVTEILCIAVALAAAAAATAFAVMLARMNPIGNWDAFALWNLKARFMFRGAHHWSDLFNSHLVHVRYPLLLPALIARLWSDVGFETAAVPRAVAIGFMLLTLGLLFAALDDLRSRTQACLGLIAVVSMPSLMVCTSYQGADTPLGFYVLAAIVCVVIAPAGPDRSEVSLGLAGMFTAFAVWTKNEGRIIGPALFLALGVVTAAERGLRMAASTIRPFLAGAAPAILLLWLTDAMFIKTPSEYVNQPISAMLGRIADPQRHWMILSAFFAFVSQTPSLLLLVILLALGHPSRGLNRLRAARVTLATVAVSAAGYYAVYLTTPYPLDWQLSTSLDRLFIQLWPTLVFLVFVVADTPEEVAVRMRSAELAAPADAPLRRNGR